jgi:hypothetical protein
MVKMNSSADVAKGDHEIDVCVLFPGSNAQRTMERWFRSRQRKVAKLRRTEPAASRAALFHAAGAAMWVGPPVQFVPAFGVHRHDGSGGDVSFLGGHWLQSCDEPCVEVDREPFDIVVTSYPDGRIKTGRI